MKVFSFFFCALLPVLNLSPVVAVSSPETDAAFQSLFNGENLSGWVAVGTPEAFTVKNGAIFSTGAGPYPAWLRTEKEYENFILRLDYMTEGWYEGGLLLHAPQYGNASKMGMKIHLKHERHEYGARSVGAIYDVVPPQKIANRPSGEWNHLEIVCNYPRFQAKLNDAVIQDLDLSRHPELRERLRRGYLGIQGLGCQAYFKNIEVQELPDSLQWQPVFPERMEDMIEFEATDWSLENGVLTGKGDLGFAISKEKYADPFELQVWVKTMVNGNGGLYPRWNDDNRGFEVQLFNVPDSTNPTGSLYGIAPADRVVSRDEEWFLVQVFCDGPRVHVRVNGERVAQSDQLQPPFEGQIAFQQHTPNAIIHYKDARIIKIQ